PLVNSETRTPQANPATRALRDGKPYNLDNDSLLLSKSNKETPVEGSIAPVYDGRGSFTGFAVVFRDITARKQAEEALGQSPEQVRHGQEMELIGRLAGGMAHDFNQLLTVISGNISLVLTRVPQSDPNRE